MHDSFLAQERRGADQFTLLGASRPRIRGVLINSVGDRLNLLRRAILPTGQRTTLLSLRDVHVRARRVRLTRRNVGESYVGQRHVRRRGAIGKKAISSNLDSLERV